MKSLAAFDVIQGRAVQIGAAADEKRHRFRERLQDFAAGFARGDLRIRGKVGILSEQIRRNFFLDRVIELLRLLGILRAPILERFLPAFVLGAGALFLCFAKYSRTSCETK